jgi:hypothetical protein
MVAPRAAGAAHLWLWCNDQGPESEVRYASEHARERTSDSIRTLGREPINSEQSADVRFVAHNGLKSGVAHVRKGPRAAMSTRNNAHHHRQQQMKIRLAGRNGPTACPLAPYGHFKLVRLCRLEHDVPWVKACSLVREHHHRVTVKTKTHGPQKLDFVDP